MIQFNVNYTDCKFLTKIKMPPKNKNVDGYTAKSYTAKNIEFF